MNIVGYWSFVVLKLVFIETICLVYSCLRQQEVSWYKTLPTTPKVTQAIVSGRVVLRRYSIFFKVLQSPLFCYSGNDWSVSPCQTDAGFDTCFVRWLLTCNWGSCWRNLLRGKKQLQKKHQMVPIFRYDATIWPHVGLARGCATSRTGARS